MSAYTDQAIFDAIVAAIHLSEKRSVTINVKKFIDTFNNHRDRKLCTSLDPLSDNGSSDEDRHGGSTPSGGATRSDDYPRRPRTGAGQMTRQEIIDLIHNEYDAAPAHYKLGDNWDDGSGRIADAVMQRIEQLEAALREIADFPYIGEKAAQQMALTARAALDQSSPPKEDTDHIDWDALAERRLDQS